MVTVSLRPYHKGLTLGAPHNLKEHGQDENENGKDGGVGRAGGGNGNGDRLRLALAPGGGFAVCFRR